MVPFSHSTDTWWTFFIKIIRNWKMKLHSSVATFAIFESVKLTQVIHTRLISLLHNCLSMTQTSITNSKMTICNYHIFNLQSWNLKKTFWVVCISGYYCQSFNVTIKQLLNIKKNCYFHFTLLSFNVKLKLHAGIRTLFPCKPCLLFFDWPAQTFWHCQHL